MALLKIPVVVLMYCLLRVALAVDYGVRRLFKGFLRPYSVMPWGPALLCSLALFALLPWSALALWLMGHATRHEFYIPAIVRLNRRAGRDLRG